MTLRSASAASRGSDAPSASPASHHQVALAFGSVESTGIASRTAVCQASRGCPPPSRACTPCCSSLKRSAGRVVLRRAARYRSLASWKPLSSRAMPAPFVRSDMLLEGSASSRASNWFCTRKAACAHGPSTAPAAPASAGPSSARSARADWIDENTWAGVLTDPMRRWMRARSSEAASSRWASRPRFRA